MLIFMAFFVVISTILFLTHMKNLLILLLILEVLGLSSVLLVSAKYTLHMTSDFFLIMLFSIFVVESVMGLFGLVLLVSFSGNDYLSASSLSRC